jgi:peptidoglycan-associated lipoprotein
MITTPIFAQKSPSKKKKKQKTETIITIDSSSISVAPVKNIEPIIKYDLYVKDKESNNPLPNCIVNLIDSDSTSIVKYTDSLGMVVFEKVLSKDSLNSDWKFTYSVFKKGYFSSNSVKLISKEKDFIKDTVELLFALGKIFKAPEIYFYDSRIDDSKHSGSYDSIMKLYNLLIMNPTMVIELQYNTDCRGSAKYNEALSLRHAKGVRDYLISKGIEPERIIPIGYGLNNPLPGLDCETIRKMTSKEEQEKAHQLNRRSEFKVLSFEYKPIDK